MRVNKKVRMNRLFGNGRCLDVAIDHGVCNEPSFLVGLEDMAGVVDRLVKAGPEAVLQNEAEPLIGAIEMDAACAVVNLFMLPDEPDLFKQCVQNISRVRADCEKYGMPLMIEPLAMLPVEQGGYMVDGDAEKIVTLTRLAREMGADVVKADPTTRAEDFHRVVEAARCPVLVRGGGKEDLRAVFDKSAALMAQGALGMVYGRNIYQHANPSAVVRGLMAIIHDNADGATAWDLYNQA